MVAMSRLGRYFMIFGFIFVAVGFFIQWIGKIPGLGRLPGDILIKRGPVTFYFPLVTSLIVSVLLSLLFTFILKR